MSSGTQHAAAAEGAVQWLISAAANGSGLITMEVTDEKLVE